MRLSVAVHSEPTPGWLVVQLEVLRANTKRSPTRETARSTGPEEDTLPALGSVGRSSL